MSGWRGPAEWLYRLGNAAFHVPYDRGWRRAVSLPVPVVSVGNLAVGGTGKTPTVIELARAAGRAGRRPAILTRGYGGTGPPGVLGTGAEPPDAAARFGDEPVLLARALEGVLVAVGRDRVRGAHGLLASVEPPDLFLLDDGFQHRRLARDVDLVLLDARDPLAGERCLPAGLLREPPAALRRATHVLWTDAGDGTPGAVARQHLAALAPGAVDLGGVEAAPGPVRSLGGGEPVDLRGAPVWAVCAVARPERFRELLVAQGARVVGFKSFRDHARRSREALGAEEAAARAAGARVVTTAKDATRWEAALPADAAWLVAERAWRAREGWDAVWTRLVAGLRL